ncbi:hypothetical protein GCM10022217_09570 [Chryseobacterium ginsenosidimutans]|uniref:hypothetical protein n=1 Tax=Chryseobacterium ginsenosidimutans TaxID=687846 RepID=UPI0031D96201
MGNNGNFTEISKKFNLNAESIKLDSKKEHLTVTGNKKNTIDGKDGVSMKNYKVTDKKEEEPYKENVFFYETDGHYSTVYLVCLMLGMDEAGAEELAIATENPDTDVHSETDFEIDQTWGYPSDQKEIHSLTGGFHGTEELLTALKFLYIKEKTPKETTNKLGELLHRFGDTYAHTKFDNIKPADLIFYDLKHKPENAEKAIESWKGQGGKKLSDDVEPWIKFINYYIDKYGYTFLTNEDYQKKSMYGRTLKQYLKEIYFNKPGEDKFIMYGTEGYFTLDHMQTDAGYPDLIYMRPDWYLCYVKNLAWIISVRFKLDHNKLNITLFEKMVKFAKENKCSMKGIIDFEIAKFRKKQEVYIPVFYSKPGRILASADAVYNTDYLGNAKAVVENTKKYITENLGTTTNNGQEAHHGNTKIHKKPNGDWYQYEIYDEDYFIIKFK